jgi:hypothetical protein
VNTPVGLAPGDEVDNGSSIYLGDTDCRHKHFTSHKKMGPADYSLERGANSSPLSNNEVKRMHRPVLIP